MRIEIGTGLFAFALYVATACRTVFVGDGGELIAAARGLGVAHPPGYPLWTLLAKLALLVPLGEPAFRTTLLSALLGALACALAARLAREWASGSILAGVAAGVLLATARTFWFSATVTEVYTAHVLLALGVLWAADRVRSAADRAALRRSVLVLGAVAGVGLAHHPTIVLVFPAAAVLARRPRPASRKAAQAHVSVGASAWAMSAALAMGIAAVAYASLLLRARLAPESTWNQFTGVATWLDHVTAAAYRPFDLGWGGLFRGEGWRTVLTTLAWDLGPGGIVLVVLGALTRGRVRVAVGVVVVLHVLFALRYGTEDVAAYLLPAEAALAILAGLGLARVPRVAGAAALVLVAAWGLWQLPSRDLRGVTLGRDYAADVLASVPQGGVLVADGDNVFVLQYALQVLGERQDLTVYDRGGHVLRTLTPGMDQALVARVQAGEGTLAFLSWPGYEAPAGLRFRPHGLVYALEREDAPSVPEPAMHAASVAAQAARCDDLLARTLAASYPILAGERALFSGSAASAEARFEEARTIGGDSETVRNTLGTIYGRRGDLARAAAEFTAALRLKPASPRAAANLRMVQRLAQSEGRKLP